MGFQVLVQFVLGAEKIIITAVPVGNVEVTLIGFNGPLLETFSQTIRTLPEDFILQICHFFWRERLLEVAVDPA